MLEVNQGSRTKIIVVKVLLLIAIIALISVSFISISQAKEELHSATCEVFMKAIDKITLASLKHEERCFMLLYDRNQQSSNPYSIKITEDTLYCFTSLLDEIDLRIEFYLTYLTSLGRFNPSDLNQHFQDELQKSNIEARTSVAIENNSSWIRSDSTQKRIKYQSPIFKRGIWGEVVFQFYVDYPMGLVTKNLSKHASIPFVVFVVLLWFFYRLQKQMNRARVCIVRRSRNRYYMGNVIIDVEYKQIKSSKTEWEGISDQMLDILLLFLVKPKHIVKKSEIIETFWKHHISGDNNLRTAIFRLREKLDNIGSELQISKRDRSGYYRLEPKEDRC